MSILSKAIDRFFAARHACSFCGDPLLSGVVGLNECCSDQCWNARQESEAV
jgi:hypothetical protein